MKKKVTLAAVGDILLSGKVTKIIDSQGKIGPFKFIQEELNNNDVLFGNLECPLSDAGAPVKNKCCIFSPSETVESLKSAGLDILSLANNHIFDYGYQGYIETVKALDENGILWFGAGNNLEEAQKPAIMTKNGMTIGFLGYSWDFIETINASGDDFGTAPLNEKVILEDVMKLKKLVDTVIVSVHWGYEKEAYPLPSQRKMAHKIIEAGAKLVLGHHPHILQGVEGYKDGIIVHSLGNFIFPDIINEKYRLIQKEENKESMIFQCDISDKGIEGYRIIPIKSNEMFQPVILEGKEKEEVLNRIRVLSEGFKSEDYNRYWKEHRIRKDLPDVYSPQGISMAGKLYLAKRKIRKII